ncbi:MAG: putative toxin-antitoxin system toxin component, PIN family [Actinomycetota bacterium]|nr:putative toxin-antitoxin system toxin component, PIN family [Actinomycetota bacterium]
MPNKPRVVLDTNVLLSAVLFGKVPGEILKLWQSQAFDISISPETLAEFVGKLRYKFGFPSKLTNELQALISMRSIHVMPEYKTKVCHDPEDNKFIDVALAANADYLVTGDEDLLVLGNYQGIKILNPKEFLEILKSKP